SVDAPPRFADLTPNGPVVSVLAFGELRFVSSGDLLPNRFGTRQGDGGPVLSVGLAANGPGVSALAFHGTPGSISFRSGDDLLPDAPAPADPASGEGSAVNVYRQGNDAPARTAFFAELSSSWGWAGDRAPTCCLGRSPDRVPTVTWLTER